MKGDSFIPCVSAIVLNYRTPQQAVWCVEALLRQTIADRLEIIVVDNHSQDDSIGVLRNRLRRLPRTNIVETADNVGFGRGYNVGRRYARGQYILFDNPTKLLDSSALECMVAFMDRDPSIGILGPKLVHGDGTVRDSYRRFPSPMDVIIKRTFLRRWFPGRLCRYLYCDLDSREIHDVDWVVGGCFLMRADLLSRIGGFDPRFFLFFEDMDLCRRVWAAGKRVLYFPLACASDRKRRLSEGGLLSLLLRRVGRDHLRSAFRYFWKWRFQPLPSIGSSRRLFP